MSKILTWRERCEIHPDHKSGMITSRMLERRMQEEIDELREFYENVKALLELIKD